MSIWDQIFLPAKIWGKEKKLGEALISMSLPAFLGRTKPVDTRTTLSEETLISMMTSRRKKRESYPCRPRLKGVLTKACFRASIGFPLALLSRDRISIYDGNPTTADYLSVGNDDQRLIVAPINQLEMKPIVVNVNQMLAQKVNDFFGRSDP